MIRYATAGFAPGELIVYTYDGMCFAPATRKGIMYLRSCRRRHLSIRQPYTRKSKAVVELRWSSR